MISFSGVYHCCRPHEQEPFVERARQMLVCKPL